MKKIVSLLLTFAMLALTVSGCGGSPAPSTSTTESTGEPVTIKFANYAVLEEGNREFWENVKTNFEKENPDITIEWVSAPFGELLQQVINMAGGGERVDLIFGELDWIPSLVDSGLICPVSDVLTEEYLSDFYPNVLDAHTMDGEVYAVPMYVGPYILYYNADLFEQAGLDIETLPTQYREAFDAAKTMKEKTGAYLYNPPEFFNLMFEEGVSILNEDNTAAAFNTQDTVDLLNSFKELTDQDILPKNSKWGDWDTELKLFETGQLAIVSSSGSSLSRIKDEAPDVYENIGVAAPLTGSEGFSRNALMNLVVPEASKHHEEAIKFAAYITGDECQLEFCKQTAIFPSTIKASQDEYFLSDSETLEGQARIMSVEVSETSKDYSLGTAGQSEIQDAVNQIQEAVIQNGTDTQTALDNGEKAVNDILAQSAG